MLSQEDFVRMVRNFGADKVIFGQEDFVRMIRNFGTDSPWASQKDTLRDVSASLNENELANILHLNAERLLNL